MEPFGDLFQSFWPRKNDHNRVIERVQRKVTGERNVAYSAVFMVSKVTKAISQMYPLKSPGPDGFSPIFFQEYWRASGQQINFDKSAFVFNRQTSQEMRQRIANCLGIPEVSSYQKYLHLLAIGGQSKREVFASIKDRVWKRIKEWKEQHLSIAGREVLLKTIIQSIPTHSMSCFEIPTDALYDIQAMMSKFW
ncbi:hypothetical protein ACH5RR_006584 [Cinchona calisaya]|uniref:Uncharacterized protein n=1 Tax=Cinchona calisaya TaxID=153742 RepID=A0ABD3APE3_9GENT